MSESITESRAENIVAPEEPGPPILILSCYRTGSTLLRYVMDTHEEVYSPPEVFLGQAAFDLAHFSAGLAGQRFDPTNPAALPGETIAWLRSLLAAQLAAATARHGKRIWCEKTPSNLVPAHLALLRQVFPEARMICLHRHCLDVVQSLLKMMNGLPELQSFRAAASGHAVTAAISYWCERTTTLLEIEESAPSLCVRLRYEDMVATPAATLEPVFRFLHLAWDPKLIDTVFETEHDRGMQDHYIAFTQSIHTGNIGAGSGVSLAGVPEKTLETMDALARRLAYPNRPAPVASTPAPKAGVEDVRWFFETHLPERVSREPDLCASFGTLYQFVVAGSNGGSWVLDPQRRLVSPGRSSTVCNVEVSAADLFAIARGGLHPLKAAEQGRLRLRGDIRMQELEKLVRLLQLTAAS